MTPPPNYNNHLQVLQRVFDSGIAPYVHPTGFNAYRIITGVTGIAEAEINPFYMPGNPARMLNSGEQRLFTTDKRPESFVEALGHTGDGPIPLGTFELGFHITGLTLNHSKIIDPEYQRLCFNKNDHSFSQSVAFYLESEGYGGQYDTHSWLTVAGEPYGLSGYVHSWGSPNLTTIVHRFTKSL